MKKEKHIDCSSAESAFLPIPFMYANIVLKIMYFQFVLYKMIFDLQITTSVSLQEDDVR